MKTTTEKLNNLLNKAREDLKIWLYYADSSTLEEFFKKAEGTSNLHVVHVWKKHENALEELEQYREWVAENDRW